MLNFTLKTKRFKRNRRRGFALVLALVLMSFMVLLIISLASMVQLQLRQSRQSINENKARNAAKYAAYQALGQIQQTLGPDQRITANAMIFDTKISAEITELETKGDYDWWSSPMGITRDDTMEIDDPAISQNRYWVGVWDSRNGYAPESPRRGQGREDYVKNTMDKALTWLVSGNGIRSENDEDGTDIKYKPNAALEDKSYVRAVSGGSASDDYGNADRSKDVLVPLVKLGMDANVVTGNVENDGREVRIAWWVSDEGQKASINAIARREQIGHAQKIPYRVQSLPFYSGIHGLTVEKLGTGGVNALDLTFEDIDDTSPVSLARNLDDVKQIDVLKSERVPQNIQLGKIFFHGVTFDTKGVLANVRDGGLKKDLSIGLLRGDYGNEPEKLEDRNYDRTADKPNYFKRPFGVAGFEVKSSAYPLLDLQDKSPYMRFDARKASDLNQDRILKDKGHMFGPQIFGIEKLAKSGSYDSSLYGYSIEALFDLFTDSYIYKDPGGPLWDQLRSYYNLRADDDSSKSALDARVQTDDRFGFKPIVKRFQVFYVPSFLDYGNQRYGLRLHIIPLMVLYNPYDAKINGDTYYAVELSGPRRAMPGKFRFAIGYESGDKFQTLRDLRTELMPSMNADVLQNISQSNFKGGGRDIRGLFMAMSQHGKWNTAMRDHSYWMFFSKYSNCYDWTYFLNQIGGTGQNALPMGYGELPADDFSSNESDKSKHWKSVVKSTNLYPDINTAVNVAKSVGNWTTRVAKVPLFLNNLVCDVNHGVFESARANDDDKIFIGQYSISAFRPNQSDPSLESTDVGWSSTLRFLAYDKNGIEPGQAKVFAMEDVVSYVGSLTTGATANNGPNGDIEGNGVRSSYESRGAMMKGLDEGGMLGGCFFIDVVHPEAEHEYKYNNGTPYEQFYSFGGRGSYDKTQRNVIFDLNLVNNLRAHLKDVNDNYPPNTINKYLIDMQDISGKSSSRRGFAMNWAIPGMTPMGYHYYNFAPEGKYGSSENAVGSNYVANYIERESRFYPFVSLDVWIWKREGLTFSKFTQKNAYGVLLRTSGSPTEGMDPLFSLTPTMTHMEGFRIFNGDLAPSFPDPTLEYHYNKNREFNRMKEVGSASNSSDYTLNYFQTGKIGRKGTGNLVSLLPAYPDNRFDGSIEATDGRIDQLGWNLEKEHKLADENNVDAENEYLNSRYYINWLGINARRHSANYWDLYSGAKTGEAMADSEDNMTDLAPAASKISENFVPSYSASYGKSYATQLHNSVSNQRQGYIPYGIIFAQPHAENSPGSQPFFNRRLYVNGTTQATTFLMDYNTKNINKNIGMTFGAMVKSMQNTSQAFGSNGDGYSSLGYDLNMKSNSAYVGMSDQIGATRAPIHHVLRKTEVVSNPANLASTHLSFGAGKASYDNGAVGEPEFHRSYGLQVPEAMQAANAIGNSLAPSRMSPDRSYQITWIDEKAFDCPHAVHWGPAAGVADGMRDTDWREDRSVLYDMSWHLNDVLWDEYFFSTLPYRNDERADAISTDTAYPQNPRLEYYASSESYVKMQDLKDASANEDQFEQNSSLLWINGPFNVNSTNVDAWKTVLSTYYGQKVEGYDGSSDARDDETPMLRWGAPSKAVAFSQSDSATSENEDNSMQGYRSLNSSEIEELAAAIVEHVKDRGPFYSMSQFVNRAVTNYSAEQRYAATLSGNDLVRQPAAKDDRNNLENEYKDLSDAPKTTHMQKGVLQAAIDGTSINSPWHQDHIISVNNDRNMTSDFSDPSYSILKNPKEAWENWRAAIGPQGTGAPTYLMQQDILSRIGSFLTVRSDTFKIRAYGEIRNPISGIVEGKAWCEMVVQRTPEYFDGVSENQNAWNIDGREIEVGMQGNLSYNGSNYDSNVDTELSELNRTLGRRFKIVGFRWLNEKEI